MTIPLDLPPVTPIQVARACYLKWKSKVPFHVDVADYLEHGIVISRPDIFWMGKMIDWTDKKTGKSEPALFVRVAVGPLRNLLLTTPVLPNRICFHRRNEERMRSYSFRRLLQITKIAMTKE